MAFFEWNDSLTVNINEIDTQHKYLIKLINSLNDAMGKGQGKDVLGKILTELIDYTVKHFSLEEKYMEKYKYTYSQSHKLEHEKLIKQVKEFDEEFKSGKTLISVQVMSFLKDWLKNHIMQNDVKFGQFLNANGMK